MAKKEQEKLDKEAYANTPPGKAASWAKAVLKDIGDCTSEQSGLENELKVPSLMRQEYDNVFRVRIADLTSKRRSLLKVREGSTLQADLEVLDGIKDFTAKISPTQTMKTSSSGRG